MKRGNLEINIHTERTLCEYKHHLQAKERGQEPPLPSWPLKETALPTAWLQPLASRGKADFCWLSYAVCYGVKVVPENCDSRLALTQTCPPWRTPASSAALSGRGLFSPNPSPTHLKFTASDSTWLPSMFLASANIPIDPCQSLMARGPGLLSSSLHVISKIDPSSTSAP